VRRGAEARAPVGHAAAKCLQICYSPSDLTRALTTVVATCYLLGVSTRRMDKLVQTLGITSLSKSQVSVMAKELDTAVEAFRTRPLDAGPYTFVAADALVLKVREAGPVVNVHALIAVGANAEGHREILGIDVSTAEDGAGWLAFWRSLTARGLSGVRLVTSDAHAGLVAALGATLPGAAWQRCRTHYTTNLMAKTPKSSWPWVRTLLHSVFDQPDAESVAAQYDRIIDALSDKLPKVADHLEAARPDLLAFTNFPKQIWRPRRVEDRGCAAPSADCLVIWVRGVRAAQEGWSVSRNVFRNRCPPTMLTCSWRHWQRIGTGRWCWQCCSAGCARPRCAGCCSPTSTSSCAQNSCEGRRHRSLQGRA
jgi:mutator family transposase